MNTFIYNQSNQVKRGSIPGIDDIISSALDIGMQALEAVQSVADMVGISLSNKKS